MKQEKINSLVETMNGFLTTMREIAFEGEALEAKLDSGFITQSEFDSQMEFLDQKMGLIGMGVSKFNSLVDMSTTQAERISD
jgi:hypothetical protein